MKCSQALLGVFHWIGDNGFKTCSSARDFDGSGDGGMMVPIPPESSPGKVDVSLWGQPFPYSGPSKVLWIRYDL